MGCCFGASVPSEKLHNQDLRRICKREYEFSNSSLLPECIAFNQSALRHFYQSALHLTRVHCATFYQSALRHELHEDLVWIPVRKV